MPPCRSLVPHRPLRLLALSCAFALASAGTLAQSPPSDPSWNRLPTRYNGEGNGEWAGNLGLGVTITRGNSNSEQVSVSLDAARRTREDRIVFHGLAIRNETQEGTQADNAQGSARYERNVGDAWFGFGQAELERDTLRDLELRQTYGGGVGHRVLQSDRTQLNLYGGLAYTHIDNEVGPDGNGVEPFVGNDFTFKISDNASVLQRLVYYPNTVDTNGDRAVLEATINTKIYGAFGLQLTVLQKYQSDVTAQRKKTDTIFFTGLTAAF